MPPSVQAPAREPEQLDFESEVVACNGTEVELADTYFFAESGGQPADRGTLGGVEVADVYYADGRTVHVLAEPPECSVGDRVDGVIDAEFRRYCQRAHTASHVVYGAARRELDELGYGGFAVDQEKVRIDVESDSAIDDAMLITLEEHANRAVWESRSVDWYSMSTDDAMAAPDVAFNVATEEEVFSDASEVRIVEITGWDRAACGGTHVRNTAEIGLIRMLDRSNPGSGLTRVEFAVGPTAIDHQARLHADARRAARTADATPGRLTDAIQEMRSVIETRDDRVRTLERMVLEERLATAPRTESNDLTWVVQTVPEVETDTTTTVLRDQRDHGVEDVFVTVSGESRSSISVGTNGDVDASEVINRVTDTLGGGGGGGSELAQGGGIPHEPEHIVASLREDIVPDLQT